MTAPQRHTGLELHRSEIAESLPVGSDDVKEQVQDGLDDLAEADQGEPPPRYPYAGLDAMTGPLSQGRVTFVAANPGLGKTTFALDVMDKLAARGTVVYVVGLEQKPKELRTKWACLRAHVDAAIAFEGTWREHADADAMRARVRDQFLSQLDKPWVDRVRFDGRTKINLNGLLGAADTAADLGARVLIVDHIDRLDTTGGRDPFEQLRLLVQGCSEIADTHALHLLVFSQLNRTASTTDRVSRYQPPQLHHLFGGSVKEQEADVVLGLFRPFAAGMTREQMAAVRDGTAEPRTILEPDTMGVVLLKHRLRGKFEGKRVHLRLSNGRLEDIPERDRFSTNRFERDGI